MKALILNGADQADPVLSQVETMLIGQFERDRRQTAAIRLHEKQVAACMGCFGCWEKTPGICLIKDDGREITQSIINSGTVILLTPIVFGGYSAELKKALDRSICLMSPLFMKVGGERHHQKRYRRYPNLLGIGVLENPDAESERIFKTLVHRNAVNLHAPRTRSEVILRDEDEEGILKKIKNLIPFAEATP